MAGMVARWQTRSLCQLERPAGSAKANSDTSHHSWAGMYIARPVSRLTARTISIRV